MNELVKALKSKAEAIAKRNVHHGWELVNMPEYQAAELIEGLQAQVEQLRQFGAELINNCGGLTVNTNIWSATSLAFGNVDYQDSANNLAAAIIKKPAQCLAEHDAQVARKAFITGCHCGASYNVHDWDNQADEYAHKVRQKARGSYAQL